MRVVLSDQAGAEYRTWEVEDPKTAARIKALILEVVRDPFQGVGKPEALRGILRGWWSRRIGREHRLVYRVVGDGEAQVLEIAQCRYWR